MIQGHEFAKRAAAVVACLMLAAGSGLAQAKGGKGGGMGGGMGGGSGGGGGHEGHGGGGAGGGGHEGHGGGGHGGHGGPGVTSQMCHHGDDKVPHYCEPSYKVASSVAGVRLDDVSVMNDRTVMVTLKRYAGDGATPRMVVVGGGGGLAGAAVVDAGWKDGAAVHVILQGEGSALTAKSLHLHAFPLTGK